MEIDRRFKGCSNVECEMRKRRVKQKIGVNYCPKCGHRNTFVCVRCFKEIPDLGPDFRVCTECKEKQQERMRQIVNYAKKAGEKAKDMAEEVIDKAARMAQSEIVQATKDKVNDTVHNVLNKL